MAVLSKPQDLHYVAAHALHNTFVAMQDVCLPGETPHRYIRKNTLVNIQQVLVTHTEDHTQPYEVWMGCTWKDMPEHDYYTEFFLPIGYLVDYFESLEPDL